MRELIPILLILPLAGCVENEEEIEVCADGSIEVRVRAKGEPVDLAEGWAVPLHAPWTPGGGDTALWLEHVGLDTGRPRTQDRAASVAWSELGGEEKDKATVEAFASFRSVEEWPRFFAPEDVPYRTAYLERSASLRVERRGRFTAYTFERTFHGRDRLGLDTLERIAGDLPASLREKLETGGNPTPEEWELVVGAIVAAHQRTFAPLVAAAVGRAGTEDEPLVSEITVERIASRVRDQIEQVMTGARLAPIFDELLRMTGEEGGGDDDALVRDLQELELAARDALREALEEGLAEEDVADGKRHAAMAALEWLFTAADHTADLDDEEFRVEVTMPGVIVSGNYDEAGLHGAEWHFESEALRGRDVVLRVVSIVE